MKIVVLLLLVALAILHHDWWWWNEAKPLVLGFIPIGLAWHAGISIAAAAVWFLATRFAWPEHLDDAGGDEGDAPGIATAGEADR